MAKAITIWRWSLGVVTRSLRTVILLAALTGLWGIGAYGLLGVPAESSMLLMVLALVWAVTQLLIAGLLVGGTVASSGAMAAGGGVDIPFQTVWGLGRRKIFATLIFGILSFAVFWMVSSAFDWINDHSLEMASFLTFHLQKPVNREALEVNLFDVVEWIVWVMIGGFLLSYFAVTVHAGWKGARKQTANMLKGSIYRTPFVTGVLSMLIFGGLAHKLADWHPIVSPGFLDYSQVVARFAMVLILIIAGALFWTLALARYFLAKDSSA